MCNLPKNISKQNIYHAKTRNPYAPSVRCPLNINHCAKQLTEYPEGQEVIWCCDDNCTNPNGQLKMMEQKEEAVTKGAHR
jgi:hypothetical protein